MSSAILEVRHLRLVRAIADEGGPTRAAARLHLTQSAVSHQLAELEHRLGIPLFARVRRRLVPTVAGARLIDEARVLLGELGRVERELHRAGDRKRDVISLVTETFTSYAWLPAVMSALPEIELRVVLAATRDPCAALLRGTIDIAIVCSAVRDPALVATPLFSDEWAVLLAAEHPLAARPHISTAELSREIVYSHDAPRADIERLREIMADEHAPMPRVVSVPLTSLLVGCVRAGQGVGLVSRWAVAPEVARGDLVLRRFTRARLHEQWAAVWHSNNSNKRLEPVIEVLQSALGTARSRGSRR